ncbi:MAG: hypothetical protein KDK78_07765, partial [Chlamydiia bacterium]|nr:hypothetical protein [Chlamydiia bacterium]
KMFGGLLGWSEQVPAPAGPIPPECTALLRRLSAVLVQQIEDPLLCLAWERTHGTLIDWEPFSRRIHSPWRGGRDLQAKRHAFASAYCQICLRTGKTLKDSQRRLLHELAPFITRFDLEGMEPDALEAFLCFAVECCPNASEFRLELYPRMEGCWKLLRQVPSLTALELQPGQLRSEDQDQALAELLRLPKLRHLTLTNFWPSEAGMCSLAKLNRLHGLDVRGGGYPNPESAGWLIGKHNPKRGFSNLRRLALSLHLDPEPMGDEIEVATLCALCVSNPNLRDLELRSCGSLDAFTMKALSTACAALKRLDLTGCDGLSLEGLNYFLASHRELRILDLTSVSPKGSPQQCAQALSHLRHLLYYSGPLPLRIARYNPSLRCLCLGDSPRPAPVVEDLAAFCPQMEALQLYVTGADSEAVLGVLAKGMQRLRALHLTILDGRNVDWGRLKSQLEAFDRLESLTLCGGGLPAGQDLKVPYVVVQEDFDMGYDAFRQINSDCYVRCLK